MKDFFKYFLASLLAIVCSVLLVGFIFFGFVGALMSSATTAPSVVVKENTILEIDLVQAISEIPQANILSAITGGSNGSSVGLFEVIRSIEAAKFDSNIKGIYLKASGNASGWATSEQLREAFLDFRTSGKFVYAYADAISQKAYYVASAADSVFINPMGMVELKGLSTNIMFYKGLLDKLEVEPQIFYCGKFKSATEPMRAYKMSPENRAQIAAYQGDFWFKLRGAAAAHTKQDTAFIDSFVRLGLAQNSNDALKYKLADGLLYKDQFESFLKRKMNVAQDKSLNFASLSDYKSRLSQKPSSNQIALLIAEGGIVDGKSNGTSGAEIASDDFIAEIRKVRADSNIKAVVMRVNSPGGSALASENILRELTLLQKDKKLVVTMGDYAASGGYYLAANADSLFAMENTITGSIGVFGVMMNTSKMLNNKLGITFDTEKTAPFADLADGTRVMTEKEAAIIQGGVDTVYAIFKDRVANGRKLSLEYVDSVGQGRVWTGKRALELKLVDGIGGLDRAIKAAASLAKLNDYRIVTYPKAMSDMDRLLKLMNANAGAELLAAQIILKQKFAGESLSVWQYLNRMINNPKTTWAMMPFVPDTK